MGCVIVYIPVFPSSPIWALQYCVYINSSGELYSKCWKFIKVQEIRRSQPSAPSNTLGGRFLRHHSGCCLLSFLALPPVPPPWGPHINSPQGEGGRELRKFISLPCWCKINLNLHRRLCLLTLISSSYLRFVRKLRWEALRELWCEDDLRSDWYRDLTQISSWQVTRPRSYIGLTMECHGVMCDVTMSRSS